MATNPDDKRLRQLANKWLKGTLSDAEQEEFDRWFHADNNGPQEVPAEFGSTAEEQREQLFARIQTQIGGEAKVWSLWPRILVAASIILALSIVGYFSIRQKQQPTQIVKLKPGTFKNDALPGDKAILTLANGQQMAVTSIPTGRINNTNIQKDANGALVYHQSDAAADVYNMLTVPRGGGKHELRLADGTLAVLDAGSSLRFPVAFNGKDRRVSITGQVYFEVVHNARQPFYVTVDNQTIEDIGTHFNINAFEGEVKTTLLEGSIKVNQTLLKPGQQAVQQINGKFSVVDNVDVDEVIGWKNDMFKFGKNTSLQTVMGQLGRWYDMDVVFEGTNKTYHFGGDIPRNSKLTDVLKMLAYSGVQFSVEGKKIIVYE